MKSFPLKLNILAVAIILPLSLSGCKTLAGWANNLGDKMPVYSGAERCDGYFCFGDNDKPQKASQNRREVRQMDRRSANPDVQGNLPKPTYGNAPYQPPISQQRMRNQYQYTPPTSPEAPKYAPQQAPAMMQVPEYSPPKAKFAIPQRGVKPPVQQGSGTFSAQKLENFKLPPIDQYKPGMIPHRPPPGMPDIMPPANSAKDMQFIEMNGMRIPAVDIPKDMQQKQVAQPRKEMISRDTMMFSDDVMYQDMEGFPMVPYEGESEDPLNAIDGMDWKKDRPKSPIDKVQQSIDW